MIEVAPPTRPVSALIGQRIEVRWSAVRSRARDGLHVAGNAESALERVIFVVAVEPVAETRAFVSAWLETPQGPLSIKPRQDAACTLGFDDPLVHVDVGLDGERVLAISLAPEEPGGRLFYAQTSLLAEAGLAPGGSDPPRAAIAALESDAASA